MAVSTCFQETIKKYLDEYCISNKIFQQHYSKENKTIEECCDYIVDQVKQMGVCGLADEEVYHLAREYYEEDNLDEIEKSKGTVVVNHTVELTEEDKQLAKEEAIEEFKQKEVQKLEEAEKKAKEKIIKQEKQVKESGQICLFDLLDN